MKRHHLMFLLPILLKLNLVCLQLLSLQPTPRRHLQQQQQQLHWSPSLQHYLLHCPAFLVFVPGERTPALR